MKKEVVIAILIGLTFGIVITVGLYRARMASLNRITPIDLPSPTPSPTANLSNLIIDSPSDETIQSTKNVTVAGTTTPNAYVVVFINNQDYLTTADGTGHFSLALDLEAGSNIITIHSINEDGQETIEERTVIFSTASLEESPVASVSAESKTGSNTL